MIYQKSIEGKIDQGDVLYPVKIKNWINWWPEEENHPIIILTPTCDIIQGKADFHRITVLKPFPMFFLELHEEICGTTQFDMKSISRNKRDRLKDKTLKAITNAWPRFHFLPKESIFSVDRIIDFEVIASVPISSFNRNLRICRLNSPHKEQLIHRYSHHTMRIGTKDLSKEKVNQVLDELKFEI